MLDKLTIIRCLTDHFGLQVSDLLNLNAGADVDAQTYSAQSNNGPKFFVKVSQSIQGDADIIQFLQDSGLNGLPTLLKTTNGQNNHRHKDHTITVYEFVDGENGFERPLERSQWIEFGKQLKALHNISHTTADFNHLPAENFTAYYREKVRRLIHELHSGIANSHMEPLQLLLYKQSQVILELIEKSHTFANRLQHQSHSMVLCHSDIHAGNVLVDSNGQIKILDWDGLCLAPKEKDLMFIGGGIGGVWNNENETKWFYEGYQADDINKDLLNYFRLERIVIDIDAYYEAFAKNQGSAVEKESWLNELSVQFDSGGVIDIAMNK